MKKFLLSILLVLALMPTLALTIQHANAVTADTTTTPTEKTVTMPGIPQPDFLPGPTTGNTGGDLQNYLLNTGIPRAINIAIGILGIGAFIGILISAIQMLTSYGNEDKTNRAKLNLRYSIMGFFIVIFSYAIVSIVVSIALPSTEMPETATSFFAPSAYAVSADDLNVLLPSTEEIIYEQDEMGRVNLPSGDFLNEIVPALVSNVMYLTGLLIFVALVYGGTMVVIGRGNEEQLTKAKSIILYAGIALALISLGYAIIYSIATLKLSQDTSTEDDNVFTETPDPGL